MIVNTEIANTEIRFQAFEAGLKHWQIAAELGVTSETFSKWLRTELPPEKKLTIMEAINKLVRMGKK